MPSSTPKQQQNRRIVLAQRPPEGPLDTTSVFREETVPLDLPTESGDILVRISYVSLDPAMRGWLRDARSYIPPVQIGAVMRASGIGRVVASRDPAIKVGTQVLGTFGWQEYWLGKGKHVEVLPPPPPGAKSLDYLGPLGMTGMTAYFGIFDVGQIKDGETVVITGAAGAVGAVVTQIALLFPKCKVIAIAGSKEKLENLKKMGCHEVINYKDKDWKEQFKTKVGYLDVYFDNVGGEMLDFALKRLNPHARIVMCGAISDYSELEVSQSFLQAPSLHPAVRQARSSLETSSNINLVSTSISGASDWVRHGPSPRLFLFFSLFFS